MKSKKAAGEAPDFGALPAGFVVRHGRSLCLACVFGLFTEQLGLAPRTAYAQVRRYNPTPAELTAREPRRPFFDATEGERHPRCPYCDASKRWHALLTLYRVEGGRQTDAARRALVKSLPTKDEQFVVTEEKRTAREVFFDWLERLGQGLDFEDEEAWMRAAARAYLERREPKTDWSAAFDSAAARVRRSQRLEEGWERDGARLFLAPQLYNEVLVVQYLVSRSHRHGGRTFEGRLTLPELLRRTRTGLRQQAPDADMPAPTAEPPPDRFDLLEHLVEQLAGGDRTVKLHYILDRRDLLDKARTAYDKTESKG
ncbi:MAG TPA: hypothetical protein VEY09_08465 [Pyrinomonadaceae bacterium]|nr:hypothetical protein [Pyrinomonadaceae bacterium]